MMMKGYLVFSTFSICFVSLLKINKKEEELRKKSGWGQI